MLTVCCDYLPVSYCLWVQWNPDFLYLQGNETWLENQVVWETGGKIWVFDWGEGNNFWFSYQEIKKAKGLRNRDSTVFSKAGEQFKEWLLSNGKWKYIEGFGKKGRRGNRVPVILFKAHSDRTAVYGGDRPIWYLQFPVYICLPLFYSSTFQPFLRHMCLNGHCTSYVI